MGATGSADHAVSEREDTSCCFEYFYDEKLAQASYLVGCVATGEALVVDPARNVTPYLREAEKEGLRITHVTETHIHADFVSGSRELAAATGATIYLSDMGDADWKYAYADDPSVILVRDGDSWKVGNIKVEVLHTPGHTPEHIAFMITDTAGADRPMGVFTGDFLFVGDVGRPDLLEEAAGYKGTKEVGARQQFQTVERFKALPDYLQIWPGHGAGSACGKALGAIPSTTLGYEKLFNPAFQFGQENAFVDLAARRSARAAQVLCADEEDQQAGAAAAQHAAHAHELRPPHARRRHRGWRPGLRPAQSRPVHLRPRAGHHQRAGRQQQLRDLHGLAGGLRTPGLPAAALHRR